MRKCMCACACVCMCVEGVAGGRHFLLFFCCWRVPMSAPARSDSVAWAGRASASLAYTTPPHTLSHSWSQALLQLLLFRPQSKKLDSVLPDRANARREQRKRKDKGKKRGLNKTFNKNTWSCGWNDRYRQKLAHRKVHWWLDSLLAILDLDKSATGGQ